MESSPSIEISIFHVTSASNQIFKPQMSTTHFFQEERTSFTRNVTTFTHIFVLTKLPHVPSDNRVHVEKVQSVFTSKTVTTCLCSRSFCSQISCSEPTPTDQELGHHGAHHLLPNGDRGPTGGRQHRHGLLQDHLPLLHQDQESL